MPNCPDRAFDRVVAQINQSSRQSHLHSMTLLERLQPERFELCPWPRTNGRHLERAGRHVCSVHGNRIRPDQGYPAVPGDRRSPSDLR